MNIKRLVIENFKSIERIELIEPNPFTVFVGPNGSGKSNIFEALEFVVNTGKFNNLRDALRVSGGGDKIMRRHENLNHPVLYSMEYDGEPHKSTFKLYFKDNGDAERVESRGLIKSPVLTSPSALDQFFVNFSRLFVNAPKKSGIEFTDNTLLNFTASNLEPVLKRLLTNNLLREEIFEWLALFVPGFKAVEVDDRDELHWFEKSNDRYFTKDLISDGTYNILALLTAVYHSDGPQFLCIEEPENGLHPEVLESLINFFRNQCLEKGHYIWINTHSESIVKLLTTDEIILVNKRDGGTQTKQVKGMNIYSLTTDEAWLSGALGGGLAW